MPRLTWIEATHGDPALARLWTFLDEQVSALSAGRFETSIRHSPVATGGIRNPANRLLSDAAMMANAVAAAEESDVLVLGCWGSPTAAIRTAVDIPVSSLTDGSARAVGSLARRAVVITVAPTLAPIFDQDLTGIGAHGFAPERRVRAYSPESTHQDVLDAIDDPATLIDRFDRAAREAVNDGADSIVVGCGYLAPIFTAHGYTSVGGHPDVPVYDCNRLAFEHAVYMAELASSGTAPAPRSYAAPHGPAAEAFASALSLFAPPTRKAALT